MTRVTMSRLHQRFSCQRSSQVRSEFNAPRSWVVRSIYVDRKDTSPGPPVGGGSELDEPISLLKKVGRRVPACVFSG